MRLTPIVYSRSIRIPICPAVKSQWFITIKLSQALGPILCELTQMSLKASFSLVGQPSALDAVGEEMAATAERMEVEWLSIQRRLAGQDFKPSGTLRVTTTPSESR